MFLEDCPLTFVTSCLFNSKQHLCHFYFCFFQDFMDEMEGRIPNSPASTMLSHRPHSVSNLPPAGGTGAGTGKNGGSQHRRSSVSDGADSLSRSGSDSSVSNPTLNHNKNMSTPLHGHG